MRVLVTGATGFIGAAVARELVARGHEVHALVEPSASTTRIDDLRGRVTFHEANLHDAERVDAACAAAAAETCLHLAWYAFPADYLHSEENVALIGASVGLFRAFAKAGGKRFVGTGTCIEYDTSHGLLREGHTPILPRTLYAVCKNALHGALVELGPRYDVTVAWMRFFFVYGPGEAPGRLVSDVLGKLARGERAPCSSGAQVRDFLHVSDMARAVALVAESGADGAINVASGVPVAVRDVLDAIGRVTARPELLDIGAFAPRPNDPPFICADTTRLRGLGFAQRHSLESGLADTLDALRRDRVS